MNTLLMRAMRINVQNVDVKYKGNMVGRKWKGKVGDAVAAW